jgi:hypothetical protein
VGKRGEGEGFGVSQAALVFGAVYIEPKREIKKIKKC